MNLSSAVVIDTLAGPGASDGIKIRSDLLPPSTHGSNLRGILPKKTWDILRIPVCEQAENRCEICNSQVIRNGKPGRPDCHEKWIFEMQGPHPVQRLGRLIALCPACHEVQHSGLARVRGREQEVIAHMSRLNGWTYAQAVADLQRSNDRCAELDQLAWNLDLQILRGAIEIPGYPTLQIRATDRAALGNSFV